MNSSLPETRASLILRLPDAADVAAWDELVAIYGPLVYRLALGKGMQPFDADDLVQEVFSAIAKSVHSWLDRPNRGKFRAWLLTIARNAAINFLTRRPNRPIGVGGDDAAQMLAEVASLDSDMASHFDLEYRREVYRWAAEQVIESVAESTWLAFWLTHVKGLSVAAAAEQLSVGEGSIYVSRSRVMNRMQLLVKQYEMKN